MDNILNFPTTTIVDSVVPKTKFYRFMEVNPRMKSHFVNDVETIRWLYKLSPDTLNVTASEDMKEIEVFVAQVSGIGEHKAGSMEEIVALRQQIAKKEAELQKLEKRMRREPQVDIQMEMHKQVRQMRKRLAELKEQLKDLSV